MRKLIALAFLASVAGCEQEHLDMAAETEYQFAGVWTWFTNPRAIRVGDYTITGGVDSSGDVVIGYFEPGESLETTTLKASLDVDDHANPSFAVLPNGRIAAWYSAHNGATIFQRVTSAAGDPSSWESESSLDSELGLSEYTYPNPVVLGDDVYLFFRADSGGTRQYWYTVSTNNGATWAAPTQLLANNNDSSNYPPYVHLAKNGSGRIDFACTDGHPANTSDNSLYHFYFDGTSFRDTDGNALTLPITPSTDLSAIWDGSTERAWGWDIEINTAGNPVVAFATFASTTDHKYRHAEWIDGSWVVQKIADAGEYLYSGEPYYSGGLSIDPDDTKRVLASVEESGDFNLKAYFLKDDGSWGHVDLAASGEDIRPVAISGEEPRLFYLSGEYVTFENYSTNIIIADSGLPSTLDEEGEFNATYADASGRDPLPTMLVDGPSCQRAINTYTRFWAGVGEPLVVPVHVPLGELSLVEHGQVVVVKSQRHAIGLETGRAAIVMRDRIDPRSGTCELTVMPSKLDIEE